MLMQAMLMKCSEPETNIRHKNRMEFASKRFGDRGRGKETIIWGSDVMKVISVHIYTYI